MSTFDVWIIRFEPADTPPAERLRHAFGIDPATARSLEQNVPKVVKHAVSAKAAGEMRQALESIGAVVECRPARGSKPAAGSTGPGSVTLFHPPGVDLFPSGRVSAIDAFAPSTTATAPRISVQDAAAPLAASRTEAASELEQPRRITAALLASSRDQQRRKFLRQAVGTMVAGVGILAIGWLLGNSVLRGEADWLGIGFDGLGIYFLGSGAYELLTTLRS
ncbi:MAG: hypothetical protein WCE62_16935 [Polyangiales bacterium]